MPQNRPRTPASASHTPDGSHTGRRRHAAPSRPNWTRRAGIVGGVVSALALSGAAAPAIADNHSDTSYGGGNVSARTLSTSLSTAVTGEQAADAIAQDAIEMSLAAHRRQAADQAADQAAAQARAATARKAAVAAKAAKARATASALAASRSAKRTALIAKPVSSSTATTSAAAPSGTKVDKLIAFLKAQIGKPYVYGATGPSSYDCSGLTQAAFATVGVNLPRTSQEQSTTGTPVSLSSLKAGDLVFWGGEGSAYHVGVYIGGGQYLDAANPSSPVGIKPLTYSEPDWAVRVL
ncbi:C40 family peptidase [Streptomyces cocklensis]|uniref:Cell wall-associated hydrolase, NlpC family n=1 Tax=Actinacidiphila cocklensis TaxID=887465 RepID=A0A9W4DJR8_9ACTN|nr:C40 family peptidase [Actinacidiphila cocklensis]MDD1061119.1 C40 family peptidase [Actinacidiphila cocklensis]CAG6391369.1 Cell wall-associated hydrolase, NlpC family [Actinacidiphila cocklensis]